MIDRALPRWLWRDEYAVMLAILDPVKPRRRYLPPEVALECYVACSLRRRWDFAGQPVTPEFEAKLLEMAAWAKRDHDRVTAHA